MKRKVRKTDQVSMNIKNAVNSIIPPQTTTGKSPVDRMIKSENATADRDANGQQQHGDGQQQREPMTDEQFQKSLEQLKNLPAVKDLSLQIEVQHTEGQHRIVILKQQDGKLIRKITEAELWTLPTVQDGEKPKGQILNKSA